MLCAFFVAVSLCVGSVFGLSGTIIRNQTADGNFKQSASVAYAATNSRYSYFAHGSTYTYTDPTKVDGFRSGSIDSDTTAVTVDSTEAHGSRANPYVITSQAQWQNFADDMHADTTRGAGKYWAIGNDITFSGVGRYTYSSGGSVTGFGMVVEDFKGSLFGLGHSLKNFCFNVNYAEAVGGGTAGSYGIAVGLFCQLSGNAVVSDLNNIDYRFYNISAYAGGITGYIYGGNVHILNCYTRGIFSRTKSASGTGKDGSGYSASTTLDQSCAGGIVGWITSGYNGQITNTDAYVTLYRCSADLDSEVFVTSRGVVHGGLIGVAWYYTNVNIYDCFARLYYSAKTTSGTKGNIQSFSGVAIGALGAYRRVKIDNVSGYNFVKEADTYYYSVAETGLFGYTGRGDASYAAFNVSLDVSNCYTAGYLQYWSGTGWLELYPWLAPNEDRLHGVGGSRSVKNVHYGGLPTRTSYYNVPGANLTFGQLGFYQFTTISQFSGQHASCYDSLIDSSSNQQVFQSTNYSTLQTEARTFFGKNDATHANNTKIWDTSKLTFGKTADSHGGYLNEYGQFGIDDSPVLNRLQTTSFKVRICESRNGTETEISGAGATYNAGAKTIALTAPGDTDAKKFVGYSRKADGTGDVFQRLPSATSSEFGYYGDMTLYAVYDVPDSAVTKSIAVSGGTEADGKISLVYNGTTGVVLSANVGCTAMSDAEYSYRWTKTVGGKVTDTFETDSVECLDVSDSGVYALEYKVKSTGEPLWASADWRTVGSKTVEITGKEVELRSGSFHLKDTAYVGMPLSALGFEATAYDADRGISVPAKSWTWKTDVNASITEAEVKTDGSRTYVEKEIIFTPNDENYGTKVFSVEVDVTYVKFIFQMTGMADDIEINAVYGQYYSHADIADLFESEYFKRLPPDGSALAGQEPWFGSRSISDYRNWAGGETLTESLTITGDFRAIQYTVTFDWGAGTTVTEQYGYGLRIPEQDRVTVPDGYILTPWKFTDKEGTVRNWRFSATAEGDADVVTGHVTLTAELKALQLTLSDLEIELASPSYTARQSLANSDLTVTAVFTTNDVSVPTYRQVLTLGTGQWGYRIVYSDTTLNILHAADTSFSVVYGYGSGTPITKSKDIVVNKVSVDLSGSRFENTSAKYTGSDLSASAPKINGRIPGIVSVDGYDFFDDYGNPVTEIIGDQNSDVVYTVRANVTLGEDYEIDPSRLSVTFTVLGLAEEVYLVWDDSTDLPYNGEAQYPKAKAYRVSDDSEVTGVTIEYSGDTDKSAVGNNYSVTASLGAGYSIRAGDETRSFRILRAVVDLPTFESGSMVYTGAEQTVVLTNFDGSFMQMSGGFSGTAAGDYSVTVTLTDSNYEFSDGNNSVEIDWTIEKALLTVVWDRYRFEVNGSVQCPQVSRIEGFLGSDVYDPADFVLTGDDDKSEVGSYEINLTFVSGAASAENYRIRNPKRVFAILPEGMENVTLIIVEWAGDAFVFNDEVQHPTVSVTDMDGNPLENITLTFGGDYASSKYAGEYKATASAGAEYYIVAGREFSYTISTDADGNGEDPNKKPVGPDFGNIPVWQLAVGVLSLLLGITFFAKGNGYRARAKEARHKAETVRKRATEANLGAAGFVLGMDETFAGMTGSVWTGIACGLAALCLLSLVWMITGKRKYARASADLEAAEQEAFLAEKRREVAKQIQLEQKEEERRLREEQKEEERRKREEEREEERRKREEEREEEQQRRADEMKMMFAGMMMNNKGGANGAGAQTTYDATASTEEIVARVVAQLLPSLQNALQPAVLHTLPAADDGAIEELRREQRELKEMLSEVLENTRQTAQPADVQYEEHITETVTETVEEPEPQVYEEVVEEIVEEPQVEEVVEEVIEEQPQVEEVVQIVEEAAAVEEPEEKPKKEKIPAEPKLTLDEAYALLSKEQKKFFDGLRAYAMSKDKCKEKKTTYFILCGQSTANPLIKLCIKKDTTVARFKLEDEYTKSLRRTAGSEGTKIKVKETEVSVSDAQAFATAKEMIDLREDQIERYEEFLKEQRLLAKQNK